MKVIRTAIISISLWCAFATAAAYSQVTLSAKSVEHWGIEEISLHSSHAFNNPFKDVEFSAQIVCNGHSMRVAGFYDGERTWRIRFMPDERGSCQFTTESKDAELNGKSGSFEVGPPSSGNHGPVRVAKTYHFSYADGTPYFLLGTTLYNWLNRDEALQRETLDTLSKSPFTKVRFGLFPKWYRFNRVEPSLYPYVETSPQKFDLDRFNPEFFRHVESRIHDLQGLGIEADIILFHPYDHLGFATMNAERDDAYIRYVCARLSAFRNVLWTMANEYDLFDPKITPGQRTKDWDHLFRTLEQSDPYQHPRGIHNLSDWYDHGKPWITHAIIQDGTGHPGRRLAGARAKYGKPIVVDEYNYEGNNGQGWGSISGAEEVSRHWDITMEGAYASHGETYVHPGGVLWWAAGGKLVGESLSRLGFLKQIMTEGPFQDVAPAPEFVQGGTVLAKKGDYYLLRVKSLAFNQHVEIQLEEGSYKVDWVDPWLMKVYDLGYTQGGLEAFDPPMTPSLLRFVRVKDDPSKLTVEPVQTLIARFLNDPTMEHPPDAVAIQQHPKFFTIEYTFGELLDDPRTNALVKKYLTLPKYPFIRALTVEQIMSSPRGNNIGDIYGFVRELVSTPVNPGSNH